MIFIYHSHAKVSAYVSGRLLAYAVHDVRRPTPSTVCVHRRKSSHI